MQRTVPRENSDHWKWKQTYPFRATSPTKARSTVWRPWTTCTSTWCFHRMAILSFFHNTFVFIFVITMATKQRHAVKRGTGTRGNLAIDGGCKQYTVPRTRFSHAHVGSVLVPSLLSQLSRYVQPHSHALTPRTRVAQDSRRTLSVSCTKKQSHFIAQGHTLHLTWLHRARALLPYLRHCLPRLPHIHFSGSLNPAHIHDVIWVALSLSPPSSTGYEPQAACWKPGSQGFHRRQAGCWTRGFTWQPPWSSTNRA